MTNPLDLIIEIAGPDAAARIVTELASRALGIPKCSATQVERISHQLSVREIATQALVAAFRVEMDEVMRGVVSAPPEHHLEWLARAQHSAEQLLAAKHWIEHFSAAHSSHTAQS